jgi:hypothetical protein
VIVHVLEFRVTPGHDAEVAGDLRSGMADRGAPDGLVSECVGRRLGRQHREHVLVTVWRDLTAYEYGIDSGGLPVFLAPKTGLLDERRSTAYEVSASFGIGCQGSRILRVYAGTVPTSAIDEWHERAAEQSAGLRGRPGLVFVIVGVAIGPMEVAGSERILAVSAWRDWDAVLTATRGHVNRLLEDTELAELETPSAVDHYELLDSEPGATAGA